MKNIRVIPRLDIKGPNLVKGIHLEGLRVLGSPEIFARHYYEQGADELLYMDVVASLYNRNGLLDIIKKTAQEIFIPLTVGGGIRTLEDIQMALRAGADKVALNTAAIKNPDFIREASRKFGSSTIMISIEAIRQSDGTYLAYTDNGREYTGKDVFSWAKEVESLGAGEILLTSVDKEGTGQGYDINLVKKVSEQSSIPVIASGGAGKSDQVIDVVRTGKADAVSMASILHYDFLKKHQSMFGDSPQKEGNVEFLRSGIISRHIETQSIHSIKALFQKQNIDCRYEEAL